MIKGECFRGGVLAGQVTAQDNISHDDDGKGRKESLGRGGIQLVRIGGT